MSKRRRSAGRVVVRPLCPIDPACQVDHLKRKGRKHR